MGDWWRFGEQKYGERAKAALESDYSFQTWMDAAWVAEKIETSRRREVLSWAHHREVAALPPAQQEKILSEAEENGWSRRDIRRAARRAKAGEAEKKRPIQAWNPFWNGGYFFFLGLRVTLFRGCFFL